jgi:hypothetical protein
MIYKEFRVVIASDLDYEDLVAEIYFKDQIVAMLTQELGFDYMEIEIYPSKTQDFWHFKFLEFENVIQYAKKRLLELRKIPEDS